MGISWDMMENILSYPVAIPGTSELSRTGFPVDGLWMIMTDYDNPQ